MSKFLKVSIAAVAALKAAEYHHTHYPTDFIFGAVFMAVCASLLLLTIATACEWLSEEGR